MSWVSWLSRYLFLVHTVCYNCWPACILLFQTQSIAWTLAVVPGFLWGVGAGGGICPPLGFGLPPPPPPPPPDMLRILFFNYKGFNDTINGKLLLCENSPRFQQIVSNIRSKIKISWGSMPTDPLVCCMLCTWIHTCPKGRDVQDCQQRLSSAFDLLLIFLCSLIQTLTLTPPPNNALLTNLDMYSIVEVIKWNDSPMDKLILWFYALVRKS